MAGEAREVWSWCWIKSGNDGRRPSGNVIRRGKAHMMVGDRSLCGREVNLYPRREAEVTCGRCLDIEARRQRSEKHVDQAG